jgi:hypothetical protein
LASPTPPSWCGTASIDFLFFEYLLSEATPMKNQRISGCLRQSPHRES